jgi:glycosyltransferase involved in cell wall biosynthesis
VNLVFESVSDYGAGVERWLDYTLRALESLAEPPRCTVYDGRSTEVALGTRNAITSISRGSRAPSVPGRVAGWLRRTLSRRSWEDPRISRLSRERSVDLWIGFCGFGGLRADRPLLVWYPDFQHHHFPQFFSTAEIREREGQWEFLKRRATGLLTISQGVARDAVSAGFLAERVFVCAPRPSFTAEELAADPADVVRAYGLARPFFIVCNQFWRHKNHHLVLDALQHLDESGTAPTVVFTGHTHDYRAPEYFDGLLGRLHRLGLWSRCRILGQIPRPEQLALMRAATAVVQPSLFEGRGLIIEEAQMLGVPVICSRLSVHSELPSDGTHHFDPARPIELAELLRRPFPSERQTNAAVLGRSCGNSMAYGLELMAIVHRVVEMSGHSKPSV